MAAAAVVVVVVEVAAESVAAFRLDVEAGNKVQFKNSFEIWKSWIQMMFCPPSLFNIDKKNSEKSKQQKTIFYKYTKFIYEYFKRHLRRFRN